jgi:hypothetical protein
MSDKELLLAAAKAAGFVEPVRATDYSLMWVSQSGFPSIWKPLEDNADAFKLMVQLNLTVWPVMDSGRPPSYAVAQSPNYPNTIRVEELHNGDHYAATRRAIVRAAAAIGGSDE